MQIVFEDEEEGSSPEEELCRARLPDVSNLSKVVALSLARRAESLERDLAALTEPADRHSRTDAELIDALESVMPLLPKYVQREFTRLVLLHREAHVSTPHQELHAGGEVSW
jgi:hypothetical protein